eukprot:jgi/Ulvmu1/10057/UM006_0004.1
MAVTVLGRLLGYGAVGGAAYGAGYTQKSGELFGDVADGISTVSQEAAGGLGALVGAMRSGFSSSQGSSRPPAPMVTHIYHDRDSGKSGVVTVLVVSGVGLTGYYAVCWWKGWDFFGLSQQRTQQMFQSLNDKFTKYTSHAKEELTRLRGLLSASQEEQARQADVLAAVNDAVRDSGAVLDSLDLKSADIAAELRRNAASNEATARSIMSVQYFLAAVAQGTVTDREQAMAMLQQSFQDQAATLPSVQEQKQIEGAKHDSSWTFSSAVAAGRQIASAPVAAITSYLWPSTRSAASSSQSRITDGAAAPTVCEITGDGAGVSRMHSVAGVAPVRDGDGAEAPVGGALGVRGWSSPLPEVSEAQGARVTFGGGGVVRSSTRMPASISGLSTVHSSAGSSAPAHSTSGARVGFSDSGTPDAMRENRWGDSQQAGEAAADGPPVRRTRPIFSSK